AGDVEGSAVIGRGADEGQPQRDRDAAVESVGLDGDVSLVVEHRHNAVILAADRAKENRVGGERSLNLDALRLRVAHGGRNLLDLLASQQSALAVMRVEPAHAQPRVGEAELPHAVVCRMYG